jgi:large subunit ribosomal protein L6
MSRIGKLAVPVPDGVTMTFKGQDVTAKGTKGELSLTLLDDVSAKMVDGKVQVSPANDTKQARSMWGLHRTLIANMIEGISKGFEKELEINGVGYRAALQGKNLQLQLGFSHDVDFPIPDDIQIKCPTQTSVVISGINKQRVGQIAAEIRSYRPPEPYKGKGVKYKDEYIFRKEGKKK